MFATLDFKAIETGGTANALKLMYSNLQEAKKELTDGTYDTPSSSSATTSSSTLKIITDPAVNSKIQSELGNGIETIKDDIKTGTTEKSTLQEVSMAQLGWHPWSDLQQGIGGQLDLIDVAAHMGGSLQNIGDTAEDLGLTQDFNSSSDLLNAINSAMSIIGSQLDTMA